MLIGRMSTSDSLVIEEEVASENLARLGESGSLCTIMASESVLAYIFVGTYTAFTESTTPQP